MTSDKGNVRNKEGHYTVIRKTHPPGGHTALSVHQQQRFDMYEAKPDGAGRINRKTPTYS